MQDTMRACESGECMHARIRLPTAAQSFFICRTHANYGTVRRFFEREFIEPAGLCVARTAGRPASHDVINAEKAGLIDTRGRNAADKIDAQRSRNIVGQSNIYFWYKGDCCCELMHSPPS